MKQSERSYQMFTGELNGRNKLTVADVNVARWLTTIGVKQKYIAQYMGVGRTTINKATNYVSWPHIPRRKDLFKP
jgi:hypothetical protein